MLRPATVSVLAVAALASAALLAPISASATIHSPWEKTPAAQARNQQRLVVQDDLHWTVLGQKIVLTTPTLVVVPIVYKCGDGEEGNESNKVEVSVAAFQTTFLDHQTAAAYIDGEGNPDAVLPTFTCDSTEHVQNFELPAQRGAFERGNIEVGLSFGNTAGTPTFEHDAVGYSYVSDSRVPVAVSTNAHPETTKPGGTITVDGNVKRGGKAYDGKAATLYFQGVRGEPAVKIGSDSADKKGNVKVKVKVTGAGTYFWTTDSTSKTQAGTSTGDYAAAR